MSAIHYLVGMDGREPGEASVRPVGAPLRARVV
jgi:hypothetical protein